ncbi:arylamine N-acetyltransferase [Methylophilus sp. TWE2]|uniref:arylamine N-acetyltransferase family protein n=1 Tax=Methylophilus sp. TWE2 TaxID=1662285 RepID=UPI000670F5AF|nr:arylamine N-acetyltransferase [Methylophilus sp. TWE2]AKR44464.1 acetyltransferase [Methylophilus sp. TWE2]
MQATNFNLQDYFTRIGYADQHEANIDTLRAVMGCQLFSVPFENLDVQAGKVISMVPEVIVDKLVYGQRGGYCYEVNGLFAMALQALGFDYQLVAARPMFYPVRRPKTHMAIVVKLGQQAWLCDLGFGSYGIRAPMSLGALDQEVQQDSDCFMLSTSSQDTFLLKAKVEQHWQPQFEFNLTPWEFIDFAPANYMNSTHPDSIFVQKLLVVLQTPEGRHVLFGNTLKSFINGVVEKRILSVEGRTDALKTVFGLTVVDQA